MSMNMKSYLKFLICIKYGILYKFQRMGKSFFLSSSIYRDSKICMPTDHIRMLDGSINWKRFTSHSKNKTGFLV